MGYVRKKEHKKRRQAVSTGEKKEKLSEEDSTRSLKLRKNEKELERVEDKPTPDIEGHNSEDDSDELPEFPAVENQLQ